MQNIGDENETKISWYDWRQLSELLRVYNLS